MFKKVILAGILIGSIGSICAYADRPRHFNWQADELMDRIDHGVRTGELSHREAARLRQEVRDVERERRDMLRDSDGDLSPRQRRTLEHDMDTVSRDIYREKHDRDYVEPAPAPRDHVSVGLYIPSNGVPSGSLKIVAH
jgi:hypothetical protein